MTLVAGRIPSLPLLQRNHYGEDGSMQGILKTNQGTTRRLNKSVKTVPNSYVEREFDQVQRNDDGKRLVRFCETHESERSQKIGRDSTAAEDRDVIMFGNNMYFVKNSDPNSAVRKLFPNSKLTPINPLISRSNLKDNPNNFSPSKNYGSNQNISVRSKPKCDNQDVGTRNYTVKRIDRSVLRKSFAKSPPETKPKPGKSNELSTPLIERIKQLTCESEDSNEVKKDNENERACDSLFGIEEKRLAVSHEPKNHHLFQTNIKDLPKQAKEGLNLMRYNQNILQTRSHPATEKPTSPSNKTNLTNEARRSFLSSLSQGNDGEPGDRSSVATSSTTADTVYSLSDIEEVLTEEEKEIKEAFSQQNKQDELELFVQQDAGRTERLRKRYGSTPKPEISKPVMFSSSNFPLKVTDNLSIPYFTNSSSNVRKEKPKFGSTIEILQQLQQQIETPYQLEGRRTACSNYSDSSIPISERLFCDESSDGYEPVLPKLNVHRSCSLDSKNYEEIEHFPSAFSVPRTKSHEHPRMAHFESEPYVYHLPCLRYSSNFIERNPPLEQNVYASSPDLHSYRNIALPNRFPSYSNHPVHIRQLHPVLQKQYCRYPVNEQPPRPAEEGKVLTPPSRMHTYMNVPSNAPCYLMPPPYQFPKTNHYPSPPSYPNEYHYETPFSHSNIYQNVPLPSNPHLQAVGRICTDRERGVPEGASSSHDPKEVTHLHPNDFYFSSMATIPKPSSVPHHYCVDV